MNRATRATVTTISMVLAIGGSLDHGLWEILQGYSPTDGLLIQAIGEEQRMRVPVPAVGLCGRIRRRHR